MCRSGTEKYNKLLHTFKNVQYSHFISPTLVPILFARVLTIKSKPQTSYDFETGWNLGPFAAVLAPRQKSQVIKYKEIVKDYK